jgi:hypothetical protein
MAAKDVQTDAIQSVDYYTDIIHRKEKLLL